MGAVREWVYPQSVKGRFQVLHRWSGRVLQAILVILPWVSVGGHPAVQFDLPARRAWILGEVFTARDTIFLVLVGLFSAFTLFLVTSMFGRIWCGFACPQTVFLEEVVRPIETLVEGERGVRRARDNGPWTFDKAWRKAVKWTLFALLSVFVAMSFTSWFAGAIPLWTGRSGFGAYGTVAFLSTVMFWDFTWFREQFCNFLCPYARFQGALTDPGSLVIAYDSAKGEPRGRTSPGCIDCKKCVAVCPQGIDIRDGFQLECIACGRCIDACEGVMGKLERDSLIRFQAKTQRAWLRPRTVVYGALLSVIALAFVVLLATRHDIDATIARAPGTLFTVDPDGMVRNTFLLKVTNGDSEAVDVTLTFDGLPASSEIQVPPIHLAPAQMLTVPVVLRVPAGSLRGMAPVTVTVNAGDDHLSLAATFASKERDT